MNSTYFYKTSTSSLGVARRTTSSQNVCRFVSAAVVAILPTSVQPLIPVSATAKPVAVSTSVESIASFSQTSKSTTQSSKVRRTVDFANGMDRADLQVIARVRSMGTYVKDWNGLGTSAPTHAAVEEAESFVRYLFSLGSIMPPYISASGDGEIDFYWKQNGFTLDLGFVGDDTYSYYAHLPNGQEIIEDEAALGEHLPQAIVDLLMN